MVPPFVEVIASGVPTEFQVREGDPLSKNVGGRGSLMRNANPKNVY
jgi:hypothetical protein